MQNYLLRWDEGSINYVENVLEAQLLKVRKQKEVLQKRIAASRNFVPLLTERSDEEMFDPKFLSMFTENCISSSKFAKTIETVNEDTLCFPLFTEEFAETLIKHSQEFVRFSANALTDVSGNERPMVLDIMKLGWLNDVLLNRVINPVAQITFSDQINSGVLDWRHGYVVAYASSPETLHTEEMKVVSRSRLVAHTDDSELTLNVCLGREFQGGQVLLTGVRGCARREPDVYTPRRGWALLHIGRQFHEVSPVTSGQRFSLIVWARSYSSVRGRTCPCCWMNNRDPLRHTCICSAHWN